MATGFRLADPREYRRGVILGLTLAEVLILLVFLLLLSAGALMARRDQQIRTLRADLSSLRTQMAPVVDALRRRGITLTSDQLASRLERVTDYDRVRRELSDAQSALAAARADAAKSVRQAEALQARIARIPKDKADAAAKAAQADAMAGLLAKAGASGATPVDELRGVLDHSALLAAANRDLGGQNEQMRREIARVKGNGGTGLPYCWTTSDGHPEFMLRVELRDGNEVVVSDMDPKPRPDDEAWNLLDGLPRDRPIPVADMISAVGPLTHQAIEERCRYAVEADDATSRTNKPGYKYLMNRIWSVFMVHSIR